MPLTSVTPDPVALTLTVVGDYRVPVDRLWAAWADPRQLEQFWGPPTWPATFSRHEVEVGGTSAYEMTGPSGEKARGYWRFTAVEPKRAFEVEDGFAKEDGTPNTEMPEIRLRVAFESTAQGSRFTAVSRFASVEAMEKLVAMGMVEGMSEALGQLDALLADLREHSRATALEIVDDTHVRITRALRGDLTMVWRAHHEAALIRRWMLGPDGWTMPVCEPAQKVGDRYRWEWEDADGQNRFGFVGEVLEQDAPRREVTSEQMIGMEGPGTTNDMTLSPLPGGRTLLTLVITYPSMEVRDMVLGTGMVDGMEASYARLESAL